MRAERDPPVTVEHYRTREPAPHKSGRYKLETELKWVVRGPHPKLTNLADELPESTRTWVGDSALILELVNSVGTLDLPHLGTVQLVTRKFGEHEFDAMLRDLTEAATSLPFTAAATAARRYEIGTAPRDEVLYHAFVYLRYVLLDKAPEEVRLLPALNLILREPHRLWHSGRRDIPIEALTRVDAHTPFDLVTRPGTAVASSSFSPSGAGLAKRLGWRLPDIVSERKIGPTTDTPENRFVKAFIGQARTIIGRMRSAVGTHGHDAFRRSLLRDCDRMEASLMPIIRHSMWEEVGTMVRIPFASTVLQRRRGYRRVLRHFSRIRLAPMIPLDGEAMRDLLELKDIATLYELWTFYRIVDTIGRLLGPPVRFGGLGSDSWSIDFAAAGTYEWASGVRLVYNQGFSRSQEGHRHSYSVGLRPDIALWVPDGQNAGLHLFDAKFRVHALGEVGFGGSDYDVDDPRAGKRTGSFKRADIYKMHAYRDAISGARSVWILYPGGRFRFFGLPGDKGSAGGRSAESPEQLPKRLEGVGAIPLTPVVGQEANGSREESAVGGRTLRETLRRVIGRL